MQAAFGALQYLDTFSDARQLFTKRRSCIRSPSLWAGVIGAASPQAA
jgi:hypothetical protein